MPFRLDEPAARWSLPPVLREVSGLAWWPGVSAQEPSKTDVSPMLLAVQDERGSLFGLDPSDGRLIGQWTFGKDGDHEGIAVVQGDVWVLRSDGRLKRIRGFKAEIPESGKASIADKDTKSWDTPLDPVNDLEGLSPDGEQLLLACKADARLNGEPDALKGQRALYAFDLENKRLADEAFLVLDPKQWVERAKALKASDGPKAVDRLAGMLLGPLNNFRPSAVTVHPDTRDLWVMSANPPGLAVLDRDGFLLHAEVLDPGLFPQPEGLVFSPEGHLFVSTEGPGDGQAGVGRLLRFDPQ